MQPTPSTKSTHPNSLPLKPTRAGPPLNPATTRLIRGLLHAMSHLGGWATGGSVTVLALYQPTDWRWAWVGIGGVLAAVCAVLLIAYFPAPEGDAG